jgi:hypothetical protein
LLPAHAFRQKRANMTDVFEIDAIQDPRWSEFIERHPCSSVFHTSQWLGALYRTYGFRPIAFSTAPPGAKLQNGVVVCQIASWLTGKRLVSLPFSDHCEPLADACASVSTLLTAVGKKVRETRSRYAEIRPLNTNELYRAFSGSTICYCLHRLDLRPDLNTLFANCHKSSTQRKVLRAERERLIYSEGRSDYLLEAFYRLLVKTRRRHGMPPQPAEWFKNLISCFGESLKLRVAFKNAQPLAAIMTLQHKGTLTYKYGCSDPQFHNLGAVQFLFWRAIMDGKRQGLQVFDLGRTETENQGLLTFKDRWGSSRSTLTYLRFSAIGDAGDPGALPWMNWTEGIPRRIIDHVPDRVLRSIGHLLYKHVA